MEPFFQALEYVILGSEHILLIPCINSIPHDLEIVMSHPENLQLPLFLALAISPVYLLVSATIFERSLGKDIIFTV